MKYSNGIPDYYKVLQIPADAERADIKKAFRKRAKEIHPDTRQSSPETLAAMRELLSAYETLIHEDLRQEYDLRYRQAFPQGGFDYREFLLSRVDDPHSLGKLIFFDLLHSHELEAIDLYDTLVREKHYDLSSHLDREDFMDCAFLLAEEYEGKNKLLESFNLMKTLVEFELERPYFKHFFQEVLDRLRVLLTQKMNNLVTHSLHIDLLLQMVHLDLDPKERAPYMKKLAELYILSGEKNRARFFFDEARKMNPRLNGLRSLETKLTTR